MASPSSPNQKPSKTMKSFWNCSRNSGEFRQFGYLLYIHCDFMRSTFSLTTFPTLSSKSWSVNECNGFSWIVIELMIFSCSIYSCVKFKRMRDRITYVVTIVHIEFGIYTCLVILSSLFKGWLERNHWNRFFYIHGRVMVTLYNIKTVLLELILEDNKIVCSVILETTDSWFLKRISVVGFQFRSHFLLLWGGISYLLRSDC